MDLVLECACGWLVHGEKERVVDAMQVHWRQIHGAEITRERALARCAPATPDADVSAHPWPLR